MKSATDLLAAVPRRLGCGIGLDLPWGDRIGFVRDERRGDHVSEPVERFLRAVGAEHSHLFLAFQPRDRQRLVAERYFAAFDSFFAAAPSNWVRAMHHTMLNMGGLDAYTREEIAAFTNVLSARYGFRWIVEDLGIWSVAGKAMPYPLPPLLNEEGLATAIANTRQAAALLETPLSLEFPGFTEGSNFYIGRMDAFDFFRRVADAADVAVTIDIGHILSYQWLQGRRGAALVDDLETLPLDRCFEFHLSGCSITGGVFRDAHHGVLLDEQIDLLEHLLPLCPNLRAITYEDPKFSDEGVLIPKAIRNVERLKRIARTWADVRDIADA